MQTYTQQLRARQLPGRLESLTALRNGTATEVQKRIACVKHYGSKSSPSFGVMEPISSGLHELTAQQRANLPF